MSSLSGVIATATATAATNNHKTDDDVDVSSSNSKSNNNYKYNNNNYDRIDFDSMNLEWKHDENTNNNTDTDERAIYMASECRRRLTAATKKLIDQIQTQKKSKIDTTTSMGLILSGGVDTCAILDAVASITNPTVVFDVAITCVIGETSPDELYSKYAAYKHSKHIKKHIIVQMTHEELIDTYLPTTIRTLEVWDGMTIRNSLVISAAFEEAHKQGVTDVLVGDGADELFSGYTFTWGNPNTDPEGLDWKSKRDSMCRSWTFATTELAKSYNIQAHGPYMDDEYMVEWALSEAERRDCVRYDTPQIQLLLGGPYAPHTTGKVLLREAFQTGSSWRRKDPIEVGSGATIIGKDTYWTNNTRSPQHNITDDEFYTAQHVFKEEEGILIQTKEYLMNIRIYMKVFGGLIHSTKKRFPQGHPEGCVGCCFEINERMFCHLCGAYPAQRKSVGKIKKHIQP